MRLTRKMWPGAVLLALGLSPALGAEPAATKPRIDPKADAAMKEMSAALAGSKSMTFEAHTTTEQLLPSGQKVQFARNQKVAMRRPDSVVVFASGDRDDSQFFYDGKMMSLLNLKANTYAQLKAPPTVDETIDLLATQYGLPLPLADFLFSDPYKSFTGEARSGVYLGISKVFDTSCHHLAFRQASVDWQIWIDAGAKAVPLKLVITYKDSPANLEYTAFLTKWDLAAELPASRFEFKAPADAKRVDFAVPATQPTE